MEAIIALILAIAVEVGIPAQFALSIALEENKVLNPSAENHNVNGTIDRGIMQLNSGWYSDANWADPETNIRAGCQHIRWIMSLPEVNTFWAVAVVYNAGHSKLHNPPKRSLDYANRVIDRWNELEGRNVEIINRGGEDDNG